MNVIIANEKQADLTALDIEVIKSISGVFDADELVQTFSNFFFGRMILDLTALKDYKDIRNLQKLSMSLDVEKIIVLLPDTPECLAPQFLSRLISMGIYNFTTNIDGVNYLLQNPNTYRDVAHLHQIEEGGGTGMGNTVQVPVQNSGTSEGTTIINNIVNGGPYILGIKNLTEHAGSTMLTFMLKQELIKTGKTVDTIEVDRKDFMYLNDRDGRSVTKNELAGELLRHRNSSIIIVDINGEGCEDICTDVIYLVEPSTIKLNKLMRKDRMAFDKLKGKKIVLNKSLLSTTDVNEFEYEAKTKVFYNMPPIDERINNSEVLNGLIVRLGIGTYSGSSYM